MAKKKIYLSPSSQTENKYVVGNTNEAVQCRKIAAALEKALLRCNFDVMAGMGGDMYSRVKDSDKWGADLHLPIHTNAYNKKVMGTRIYCYSTNGEGYKASKAIMATLKPITPGTSDSINAKPELYEIRKPKAPTAYIEVAFHDNEVEAPWIIENTEAIAEAICKGVCNHYGVKYVAPAGEPTPAPAPTPEPELVSTLYRVQVGAFSKKANAERKMEAVKAAGFDAFITCMDDTLWRVQVGAFAVKANADKMLEKVLAAGFTGYVTKVSGKAVK